MFAERISVTTRYDLSTYTIGTVLLVSYSNGGLAVVTKWSDTSYRLDIIHASANDITPSIQSDYSLLFTLGANVLSHIVIIELK